MHILSYSFLLSKWCERYIFPCLHIHICCHFFKIAQLKTGWRPHDQCWPSSCGTKEASCWLFLDWHSLMQLQIQKHSDYYGGNAIFQLENLFKWFLEKEIKRIYYWMYFWDLGRMRSGKWTRERGAENTIVLFKCSDVCT